MQIGKTVNSPDNTIEVSVLFRGYPQYLFRRADGALFVAGVSGHPYTLGVRNLTSGRIEVISSVDGRHTLKDERADPDACRGLVLPADRKMHEFTGWRVDDTKTREFVFGDPEHSVAVAATGSASNVGVIGFAAWRERGYHYNPPGSRWQPSAYPYGGVTRHAGGLQSSLHAGTGPESVSVAGAASAPEPRGLGTGIGDQVSDPVSRTSFTRQSGRPDMISIGYDSFDVLNRMGITGPPEPNAFPGIDTGYGKY